jgi:Tfp pilus assembly major pilin PilA
MKEGSMTKMMSKKVIGFVKIAAKIGQNYYPEVLAKMYIVNAPMMFSGVWSIVKNFIDKKTADKINIHGSKYQKDLLTYVSNVILD